MGEPGQHHGKDFISGLICLWFLLTRSPVRILTTSADHSQLEAVLWGEIRRFIQVSAVELRADKGGPLIVNHMLLRKSLFDANGDPTGEADGLSYCMGRVAAKGEGMLGHHVADTGDGIPRTLAVIDEASGVDDVSYERMATWAKRIVAIGNCYRNPQGPNFFEKLCEEGNLLRS